MSRLRRSTCTANSPSTGKSISQLSPPSCYLSFHPSAVPEEHSPTSAKTVRWAWNWLRKCQAGRREKKTKIAIVWTVVVTQIYPSGERGGSTGGLSWACVERLGGSFGNLAAGSGPSHPLLGDTWELSPSPGLTVYLRYCFLPLCKSSACFALFCRLILTGRQRQEDGEFKTRLYYISRPYCPKIK